MKVDTPRGVCMKVDTLGGWRGQKKSPVAEGCMKVDTFNVGCMKAATFG